MVRNLVPEEKIGIFGGKRSFQSERIHELVGAEFDMRVKPDCE